MLPTVAPVPAHTISPLAPESPSPGPARLNPPPVRGPLPISREAYEKLPLHARTVVLDFLILGKIPDSDLKQTFYLDMQVVTRTLSRASLFSAIVTECLKRGETEALDFLWRESGLNPNSSTVTLAFSEIDGDTMKALADHCKAHHGLRVDLFIQTAEPSVIPQLAKLLTQGNVRALSLQCRGIASAELAQIAANCGQLEALKLEHAKFDSHSEMIFGKTLCNSRGLKKLILDRCDFGNTQGTQFIEGMQKNQSVEAMRLGHTSISVERTADFTETGISDKGFAQIVAKNTSLRVVELVHIAEKAVDTDSIIAGLISHPCLECLDLQNTDNYGSYVVAHPEKLNHLIEANHVLTTLRLDAILPDQEQYKRLAAALKRNTSLTELTLRDQEKIPAAARQSIEDTLARNRALVDRQILSKAGRAFDPKDQLANGLTDAGSVIARYVLANSSTLDEFAQTMAVVEIAMQESINQAMANLLTDTTTTTSTTTTTTTTNSTPGPTTTRTTGPASS